MNAAAVAGGPEVGDRHVTFRLADPQGAYAAVGLEQEIRRPRDWTPLARRDDVWELVFPRPDVWRMEYKFKVVCRDGGEESLCDPANPLRAPGAFGDKSVVEFPDYERPGWLDDGAPVADELFETVISSRVLRRELPLQIWTSAGADPEGPLPLLLVHDGWEYARYASLLRLLDHLTSSRRLPALRAVLLEPVDRDETYSASSSYTRALANEVLPALQWLAPSPVTPRARVALGASLGALALLHAQWLRPGLFGGLVLQSGSYFRQRTDPQESGFPRFRRISRFVGEVLAATDVARPVPVSLTCGAVEENLKNNEAVAAALARAGFDVELHVPRDAHNYVAWRDVLEPALVPMLRRLWT